MKIDKMNNTECKICHGNGSVRMKCKDLGTLEYIIHIVNCPICHGSGENPSYDRDRAISTEMLDQIV